MEEYFRKILRNDVYCIPDEERNLVKLCIHYNGQGVDDHISYKDSRNYRLYEEALKLISNFKKFRLDLPAIIADERFYKSSISGKVSRKALKEAANDSSYQYQCFIAYNASKRKFIKDFIEAYEYKNCELIPEYEKFQIMIRLKKCAIFPEYDFSYCGFHLVSVNDELGEYIFEVDADFYFYHDAFTYLETNADVSKMGEDKDALFKELLLKYGIDEDIKNELMNCGNFTEAYKPINQKDKIANILRQTLINAIVATLSFMEPTEARKFLESIKVKPITKDPVKAIKY